MKTCKVKDCFKPVVAKGLCSGHYTRLLRGQNVDQPLRQFIAYYPLRSDNLRPSGMTTGAKIGLASILKRLPSKKQRAEKEFLALTKDMENPT